MKVYLVRHGDYVMDTTQQLDVLTEQGIAEVNAIVNMLKPLNIHVANIFYSNKNRAQQTAELLSQGISSGTLPTIRQGLNPNDDVSMIASEISAVDEDWMLVGHLPFMGRLASQLILGNENKEIIAFLPGTMACLEQIDTERWVINWVLSPNLLKR